MDYRKAMDEAILLCTILPNLRCGLFIRTEAEYDVVCELIDECSSNVEIKLLSKEFGWVLTFARDSMIYIICFSNDVHYGLHAPRLHVAYISENIEQEVCSVLIYPMMIPYQFRDNIKFIGTGECGNLKQTK